MKYLSDYSMVEPRMYHFFADCYCMDPYLLQCFKNTLVLAQYKQLMPVAKYCGSILNHLASGIIKVVRKTRQSDLLKILHLNLYNCHIYFNT